MMTVLLAATDPAEILATGQTPAAYAPLATAVVDALRRGAPSGEILGLLPAAANVEAAAAFTRSAITWWDVDAARENPFRVPLACAA